MATWEMSWIPQVLTDALHEWLGNLLTRAETLERHAFFGDLHFLDIIWLIVLYIVRAWSEHVFCLLVFAFKNILSLLFELFFAPLFTLNLLVLVVKHWFRRICLATDVRDLVRTVQTILIYKTGIGLLVIDATRNVQTNVRIHRLVYCQGTLTAITIPWFRLSIRFWIAHVQLYLIWVYFWKFSISFIWLYGYLLSLILNDEPWLLLKTLWSTHQWLTLIHNHPWNWWLRQHWIPLMVRMAQNSKVWDLQRDLTCIVHLLTKALLFF